MNKIHRKTLDAICSQPITSTLEWRKIESLLRAIGANVVEGSGSRVRFEKNGVIVIFHRPHPGKEAKPYQVKDAKLFLQKVGVII